MHTYSKLLVADDHLQIRGLIKGLVGDLFAEIYEVEDGGEACECYARQKPDWVLMDIRMKSVSGLLAAARIIREFPEARIIVVTHHDAPELRIAAQQAGAWGYVLKEDMSPLRGIITSGISSTWSHP